ncbi:MAG: family permease [Candidatus Aminicenantes bacterium]|jgi:amino acid transporter|nr:family permease [Candidatus Aminicenantes bacterium]
MNRRQTESAGHSAPELGKELKPRQYFTLAFGNIIGVGWIIVLGKWLEQGGPLGTLLAFAVGALVMMAIGLCYAELAAMIPVAGGEFAYAYEVFGTKIAFAIGWFLALVYVTTTAFEAISFGWIMGALLPVVKGPVLYSFRGDPVQLGGLLLGLAGMAYLARLNYRGLKSAAVFQDIFTYGLLIVTLVFVSAGIFWGRAANLVPYFSKTGIGPAFGGFLAVFLTTPFFLAGFNVIPQTMEEKAEGISNRKVVQMIILSISMAGLFYGLTALAASMAVPWKEIVGLELPAAGAFQAAFHSPLLAEIVLVAGLCGIVTTWNTVFISSSRVIFALSRARIIPPVFGRIHRVFKSPFNAILFAGALSSVGVFLGRSAILPIINVAGSCYAFAYFFTCLSVIKLRRERPQTLRPYRIPGGPAIAAIGVVFSVAIFFLTIYEAYRNSRGAIPLEWILILVWAALGLLFWMAVRKIRFQVSEEERRSLILGRGALLDDHSGKEARK